MAVKSMMGSFNGQMSNYDGGVGNVSELTGTTIDCDIGNNFRHLSQSGNRTYNIHNFKDNSSISVLVSGQANNVITFNAYSDAGVTPLVVKYGAGQNGTMASAYTLFSFFRSGGDLGYVVVGPIHGIS